MNLGSLAGCAAAIGRTDAATRHLSAIAALAERLGTDAAQFATLLDEAARAYHTDRGQALVAAAFPEMDEE